MKRISLSIGLALFAGFSTSYLHELRGRLNLLETEREETAVQHTGESRALRGELVRMQDDLAAARSALEVLAREGQRAADLAERVELVERDLDLAALRLEEQRAHFETWRVGAEETVPAAFDARIEDVRRGAEDRLRDLDSVAQGAMGLARDAVRDLHGLQRALDRDPDRMWRELVGPTVQLMGESTVGSGVLLASEPMPGSTPEDPDYRTYLLTAWHVVRDIQAGLENLDVPVPVTIYLQDGRASSETARLLAYEPGIDAALLQLNSRRPVECGARLASPARIEAARVFEAVYAVGCPLGNDPIPTWGEVADTRHSVDGQAYWMISAPTYIGNSGGGIFDAETHELLGIFSKIYTHGSLHPTVVPHMGLVTPLSSIFEWLDDVGYTALVPPADARGEAKVAAASTAETESE